MEAILDFFNLKGLLLVALIFIPIERLRPARADQKILRRGWKTDAVYMLVNGPLIKLSALVMVAAMVVAFDWPAIDSIREQVARQPHWLQAIEFILLADLGFYWTHRAFHHFPVLWKFHIVHHSIEELDWLAGHRVHALDQALVKVASLLPFILFGFSEWALAAYALTYKWQSVLLHSNVVLGFGPFDRLIASPNFHHWHHGNQPEAYNRNFAGQLSLWDYVFGTAFLPAGQLPTRYGVFESVPSGFLGQFLYPFRRRASAVPTEASPLEPASPKA